MRIKYFSASAKKGGSLSSGVCGNKAVLWWAKMNCTNLLTSVKKSSAVFSADIAK